MVFELLIIVGSRQVHVSVMYLWVTPNNASSCKLFTKIRNQGIQFSMVVCAVSLSLSLSVCVCVLLLDHNFLASPCKSQEMCLVSVCTCMSIRDG